MSEEKNQTRAERRLARKKQATAQRIMRVVIPVALLLAAASIFVLISMNSQARDEQKRVETFIASITPSPTPVPTPTPTPVPTPVPTPTPDSRTVLITVSGDCTIGGNVRSDSFQYFDNVVNEKGYDYFFDNVRSIFEGDDLTIINFEGTLPDEDDDNIGHGYNFAGRKEYVQILTGSSVELANLANNHSSDFGDDGMIHTADTLEAAGIGVFGFDHNYITTLNGVVVGVCGYTEWRCDLQESVQKVKALRQECDLLIVNMHWGAEKWNEATEEQVEWGHALVDAGADIVVGNHSHVISCMELYKGKYILYSLGNFCFGGNRNPDDMDCFLFQQEFYVAPDGTVTDNGIRIIPCSISSSASTNNFQPTPLTGSEATRVINKIKRYAKVGDGSSMVWLDGTAAGDAPEETEAPENSVG